MIGLLAAILVAVSSVISDFGRDLSSTDSSQKFTLHTTNNFESNNGKVECSWLISAPSNEVKWKVLCGAPTTLVKHALASFNFNYIYLNMTMCVGKSIKEIIKGSTPTSSFTVRRCLSENSAYKGVTFMVSYNPKDISTSAKPSCKCGVKGVQRIIGGKETTPNKYPWVALLIYKLSLQQFCGGSLIARQWVLSATHCVKTKSSSSILVGLGEHNTEDFDSFAQYYYVTNIITHDKFNQHAPFDYDIALLELVKPVDFNEVISPICLPFSYKDYDFSNKIGIAAGWGLTIRDNKQMGSKVLKEINQRVIMPHNCTVRSGYSWNPKHITENMICALALSGSIYDGDSGSPLVWMSDISNLYIQLGVASFYGHPAGPNVPDVYTRVSQFVDWIVEKTGLGDEFCNNI